MLETSTDLLLIAIAASVLALAGYLSYLIYHTAKTVQEAKKTVGSSINKKKLVEAVENLGNALSETRKTREMKFNEILKIWDGRLISH